ncbi:unnamed protein product [Cyprideis torosa]|uniref:Uncharacterized protein n=1 Tax=Cyprideis torosa TaxID=163714 RepID=A0A7R8ZN63_9CRUS|nr:unnamed protein product [Cyprideis torosa]CAG0897244.1 unnamed protein product [Cyprideis torosa]
MIPRSSFLRLVAKRSEEMDTEKEILKAFRLFDDDATGKISLKNLQRVAKQLGESVADTELKVRFWKYPVEWDGTKKDNRAEFIGGCEMISEADRDGDGEVSLEDFKRIMKKTCLY